MDTLTELPNIGKITAALLTATDIDTPEKLVKIGSKEAFLRIRTLDPTACLHMLYGLEGAVQGIRDTALTAETKQDLKSFFNHLKAE